jgi:hypothetical protein
MAAMAERDLALELVGDNQDTSLAVSLYARLGNENQKCDAIQQEMQKTVKVHLTPSGRSNLAYSLI